MFLNQETPWKNELDRNRMAELPRSSVGNWPYQATLAHSNINLRKSLRLVIYNEGETLGQGKALFYSLGAMAKSPHMSVGRLRHGSPELG